MYTSLWHTDSDPDSHVRRVQQLDRECMLQAAETVQCWVHVAVGGVAWIAAYLAIEQVEC